MFLYPGVAFSIFLVINFMISGMHSSGKYLRLPSLFVLVSALLLERRDPILDPLRAHSHVVWGLTASHLCRGLLWLQGGGGLMPTDISGSVSECG